MKSLVLFSGGIDSALAAYLTRENNPIELLNIDYSQAIEEIDAAYELANWFQQTLYTAQVSIPLSKQPEATNYIPFRNQILLSIACAYAVRLNCQQVVIGANKDDYTDYPDCRTSYIRNFMQLINGYEHPMSLHAPLLDHTKKDIIAYAHHKGIPFDLTFSCYTPAEDKACGTCNACQLRLQAFYSNGLEDPISYVHD